MNQVTIVAVFLLTITSHTIATSVVELDDSNFDKFIQNTSDALVMFSVSWSSYCVRFCFYNFELAAKFLEIEDPTKKLINVDCKTGERTCKKFKIEEYPTMILFKNGAIDQKYTGSHTTNEIVSFMKAQPPSSSIEIGQ